MKSILLPVLAFLAVSCGGQVRVGPIKLPSSSKHKEPPVTSFFDLQAVDIHGDSVRMDRYRGHKLLVVNTASECGNTPQYTQLEEIYDAYKDKGLVIIGFPSNDFGGQEPGTEAEIEAFCTTHYGVTFPMMAKVSTKGEDQHAVYRWLTRKEENGKMNTEVTWNFQKYLIDEEGHLVTMVAPDTDPTTPVILNWLDGKR